MEDILPSFRTNCTQALSYLAGFLFIVIVFPFNLGSVIVLPVQLIKPIGWEELSHYSARSSANIRY